MSSKSLLTDKDNAGAALLHDAVEQWRAARDIIDCVLIGGEEHG